MATKHSFTPVTIIPPPPPAPNVGAGAGPIAFTVKTLPNDADVADIANFTFVEYIYDAIAEDALEADRTNADLEETAARARRINFFKFGQDGTNPKYIEKHDAEYVDINNDVDISDDKKYLIMRRDGDGMLGGSKSSRNGRKSARKGRKSARKSRKSKGSRSKK